MSTSMGGASVARPSATAPWHGTSGDCTDGQKRKATKNSVTRARSREAGMSAGSAMAAGAQVGAAARCARAR